METIQSIITIIKFLYQYGDPVIATLILIALILILLAGLSLIGYLCYTLIRLIKFIIRKISNKRKEDSQMSDKQDKTIQCKDCGNDFVFTAGEQEFYEQHQFSEPVRCKSCRDARKAKFNN